MADGIIPVTVDLTTPVEQNTTKAEAIIERAASAVQPYGQFYTDMNKLARDHGLDAFRVSQTVRTGLVDDIFTGKINPEAIVQKPADQVLTLVKARYDGAVASMRGTGTSVEAAPAR